MSLDGQPKLILLTPPVHHIFLTEDKHIFFDVSSTGGYMRKNNFNNLARDLLIRPQLVRTRENPFSGIRSYIFLTCLTNGSGSGYIQFINPQDIQSIREKWHILFAEDGHIFLTCLQLAGTWVQHIFRNLVSYFLTCPQLVGTWVQKIFGNVVPDFWRVMSQTLHVMACQYLSCQ